MHLRRCRANSSRAPIRFPAELAAYCKMHGEQKKKKVAFITSHFPYDGKEPFLHPELQELAGSIEPIIVPVASAMTNCWFPDMEERLAPVHPPFAAPTFAAAIAELLRRPWRIIRVFISVVSAPRNARTRL